MRGFETKRIELDKGSLEVIEKGSGRPFLLLTGFPFGAAEFAEVLEVLSWSSRAIAADLPALLRDGLSPDPSPGALADTLLYSFAKMGVDGMVLGACDIGGPVALEIISKAGGMVRGAMFWNTCSKQDDLKPPSFLDAARTTVIDLLKPNARVMAGLKKHLNPAVKLDDELVLAARANLERASRKAALAAFKAMAKAPFEEYAKTLSTFRKPVGLTWGGRDAICPVEYASMFETAVPGLKARVHGDAGHFLGIEKPGELAQALQELGRASWQ